MEICAPAGNIKSFKAAVACGADAVYLGLDRFNLRMKADNFMVENLKEHIDYAHLFGVKVFLALNACVKQDEYFELLSVVDATKDMNPDAYIITDISLIEKIKNKAPRSDVHISTQAGIHNSYGAEFIQRLGADRIILSRETDLDNIKRIKESTSLEIEIFAHGALCVSFSGACLFGSLTSERSGNRGLCPQLCRLPYTKDGKKGYFLSPKDICLADKIGLLKGVDAIKIEGRLKRPEYVAESVGIYRKAISGAKISESDINALKKVYNRGGFCSGYLNGSDIISPSMSNHAGMKAGVVGEVKNGVWYSEISVIPEYSYQFNDGDGYKIIRDGKEICGGEIVKAFKKADRYLLSLQKNLSIASGDAIHITSDTKRLAELNGITRKIPLTVAASLRHNEPVRLTASANGLAFTVCGTAAERADNAPLTEEAVSARLMRVNEKEDVFKAVSVGVDIDGGVFYPLSALNNLRRAAIDGLKELLLSAYADKMCKTKTSAPVPPLSGEIAFADDNDGKDRKLSERSTVEIQEEKQICAELNLCDTIIYAPFEYTSDVFDAFFKGLKKNGIRSKIYLKLPLQADEKDLKIIEKLLKEFKAELSGISGDNYYAFYLSLKYGLSYFAGLFHNVYNKEIMRTLKGFNPHTEFLLSAELNAKEAAAVSDSDTYLYAYGHLPLMNFKHCPSHTFGGSCAACKKETVLGDEKYRYSVLPVRVFNCYNALYNPFAVNLSRYAPGGNLFFNMLGMTAAEIAAVIGAFADKKEYISPTIKFTSGHFKRGVI
ncbi:MAG: U32 family peptidase [Clostridiales bacterium]|jgi:putative protease|nr:U32 family peptidase [Clostridiales bacterium]